jgi:hypothetical protein
MKQILSVAVLLLLVAAVGFSQVAPQKLYLKNAATYANSQVDTLATKKVGAADLLSLFVKTTDSVEVVIYVDYSNDNTTWSNVFEDSLESTSNTGAIGLYSIRDGDSDLFDNVVEFVRVRAAFRSSKNGVTSPAYTVAWYYNH